MLLFSCEPYAGTIDISHAAHEDSKMTFRFCPEGDVASVCDHRMAMNKCNRYIMSVYSEAAVGGKKKWWSDFLKRMCDMWAGQ